MSLDQLPQLPQLPQSIFASFLISDLQITQRLI